MIKTHSEKKANKTYKYVVNLLGVLVVALLAWYLYKNQAVFSALRHISWQQMLIIILVDTLSFLIISLMNYVMIQRLDPRVSFLTIPLYYKYHNSAPEFHGCGNPLHKHSHQALPTGTGLYI